MSAHATRKTVATVALAAILAASPALPGRSRQASRSHLFSWLPSPLTWVAAALGITNTTNPAPTPAGPVTSVAPPLDGRGWSIDPMGGEEAIQ